MNYDVLGLLLQRMDIKLPPLIGSYLRNDVRHRNPEGGRMSSSGDGPVHVYRRGNSPETEGLEFTGEGERRSITEIAVKDPNDKNPRKSSLVHITIRWSDGPEHDDKNIFHLVANQDWDAHPVERATMFIDSIDILVPKEMVEILERVHYELPTAGIPKRIEVARAMLREIEARIQAEKGAPARPRLGGDTVSN